MWPFALAPARRCKRPLPRPPLHAVAANGEKVELNRKAFLPGGVSVHVRQLRQRFSALLQFWAGRRVGPARRQAAPAAPQRPDAPRSPPAACAYPQTFSAKSWHPAMAVIVTPTLRIEAKMRQPTRPAQIADPLYGEW